ncbi:hypothetical protein [Mucilaginibacter ginkgonis]|uniref:Uncharacterized protein n=1 Tax=Mucilaginibacter ginkgonis TaxID=2682091 RepID=A0A6I4I0J0_9SPHI|nr:hypothetical protein [Mucilaginibacter ginkgonis]QQL48342.1 hypothetical protein GO620_009050 [Mucilaginibacter ginkgonis]
MTKVTFLLSLVLTFCLAYNVQTRRKTELKDVTKILFYYYQGGISNNSSSYQVIFENGKWNDYRLKLHKSGLGTEISDSTRTFIKSIDQDKVSTLLNIVDKSDTSLNISLFKVNKDEIVFKLDSLYPEIQKSERKLLIKTLTTACGRRKALRESLRNFPMDDKSTFRIVLVTRFGSYSIIAKSFASLYEIPWDLEGAKSQDPRLGLFFHYIMDETKYENQEKIFLYDRMIREAYHDIFKTYLPVKRITNY